MSKVKKDKILKYRLIASEKIKDNEVLMQAIVETIELLEEGIIYICLKENYLFFSYNLEHGLDRYGLSMANIEKERKKLDNFISYVNTMVINGLIKLESYYK